MSPRRAAGGPRRGQGPIMGPLWERRSRTTSDGKGIWVPRHEACGPPSCPVARSGATRRAEARSRYGLPSELRVGRPPDGAAAPSRGEGEEKGGESPGDGRGRGGKGVAEGGGTERRRASSPPSGGGARGPQSSEAQPSASAGRRAERERPRSAGGQGGGERARVEERRRPRERGRRAPETLASVPLETVRVSPVGRFYGRPATNSAHCRKGPERPVRTRRSAVEPSREGAFPPASTLARGRGGRSGENGGPARLVRPGPEEPRSERPRAGPYVPGTARQRTTGAGGLPRRGKAIARGVTGRGSFEAGAERGRRDSGGPAER